MKATYNITDNRLKFWADERLDDEQYKKAKALKFQWFPGQKCFSAIWSPGRVDFIMSFGAIIEEDDTPDDLAGRVQRFQKYAETNEADAGHAKERAINANTARQLRQAEGTAANKLESAEHWQNRIAGAIRHAEHKDRPDVIVRRIKKIEASQRKVAKNRADSEKWLKLWDSMPLKKKDGTYLTLKESALYLSGYDPVSFSKCYTKDKYPNSTYEGKQSIYSALGDDVIDAEEARQMAVKNHTYRIKHATRWLEHDAMRIEYETAYLVAVGGSVDMLKPKPKRKSIAPDDGLKKGDIVMVSYGGQGILKAEILTLYAKSARVKFIDRPDINKLYPKGNKAWRRFLTRPEQVNA